MLRGSPPLDAIRGLGVPIERRCWSAAARVEAVRRIAPDVLGVPTCPRWASTSRSGPRQAARLFAA
jgi:hypothetical protein